MSTKFNPEDLKDRRITVLGAGRSGLSVTDLLRRSGSKVFLSEGASIDRSVRDELHDAGVDLEQGGHTSRLLDADFIVTSPGVPTSSWPIQRGLELGIPVFSEIEAASWYCQAPIVAITGSNGKTTTTGLTGHIFETAGRVAWVAGNIGRPFSEVAARAKPKDVVVLEISSFQLDYISSFRPDVSVLLNVTPDHLDRYEGNLDAYAESKFRICENQRKGDAVVYNMDDERISGFISTLDDDHGPDSYGFTLNNIDGAAGFDREDALVLKIVDNEEVLMQTEELALPGQHNAYNSLAAAVAARVMEVRSNTVRESLSSFEGIPHRLEFVREVEGVQYINDSKATNVNAVWYALGSFNRPIVLIAGGRDKGNDYDSLKPLVADRVRVLISIGESGETVDTELGPYVDKQIKADSLADAVQYAAALAREGEAVLMSPGCASFDMFRSFEERGDVFKRLVSNI